nr:hypothetical protein 16 [bacterium]
MKYTITKEICEACPMNGTRCDGDAKCRAISAEEFVETFRGNTQFSEETIKIIIRGVKETGIGIPLKHDGKNFVFLVHKDLFEKGKVPGAPKGVKKIVTSEEDCEAVKARIKEEKMMRDIMRHIKGDAYAM